MLKIKFRNLTINCPLHDNLLRQDVDKVLDNLNEIFSVSEVKLKNLPPDEICYCFTRVNQKDRLVVAFFPGAEDNPYLFFWPKDNKDILEEIPFENIRCLKSDFVAAELKANVRDIDSSRFKRLRTPEITKIIQSKITIIQDEYNN